MAQALLRPCAHPGCPALVRARRCAEHALAVERRRGSASSRGYDSYWSNVFRPWFVRQLIAAGIAPVCGAALPGGPAMPHSRCRAEGRLNGARLILDHEPPLRPDEERTRRVVCNPLRVGFLCHADHNAKHAQRQQHAGLV